MALTWDDLLIENICPEQARGWLAPWFGIVHGSVAPLFLNKFGSWFLRRPEGHIEMLDVFTGCLSQIAGDSDTFLHEVKQMWWQEVYLLSELVYHLHGAGKVPGPGQCYAVAPHPALGGPNPGNGDAVDPGFVMVMEVGVWQTSCARHVGLPTEP
jgi:hypothetical protein